MKENIKSTSSHTTKSIDTARASSLARQHEKAILIVLAYLIGFITAFIAFKLSDGKEWSMSNIPESRGQEETSRLEAIMKEGDLYAHRGGVERALSVYSEREAKEDGFHYDVPVTSASPNDRFLHYCVQPTADSDTCDNFIYSFDEDVVYRVKNSDGQITSAVGEDAESVWLIDGKLSLGDYQSVSADAPWQMDAR
ncbi:hypothetical protein A2392_01735 [Candidatus Kaiserbacteria bacterium RIFOXYB1_FULL_46_14]|uniref:Uncharacterized protein n=1 Tax=Candidatus Kaiserbacteria bacterium RIFOXYB1_FULL_46_14 TaxID=1798531 RepID=A0A1F6FJY4_9BACT|nr:MAG: hypothetical protein A2392_01735 [Candidatus Kaiserbacteria bacterium RIFOXYB1_FULL_46_14]